ncbi:hypothetical protein [Oryzomicrobium sp.]|uniref:hypothetical protein n=1 Tax=Oryzomicrobium sp. TaxID=1911578 RepID=UPI0025E5F6B1|nr:hypothetical protein [Oryzomicrobium sp.]MCE1242748.1 hypothetical protein [Oryzomicrobium sp.]
MKRAICVGIALEKGLLRVATRIPKRQGEEIVFQTFASDSQGHAALAQALKRWEAPLRLAVAAAGAAAVTLAVGLADVPRREVILVSPAVASQPADLARFASRAP